MITIRFQFFYYKDIVERAAGGNFNFKADVLPHQLEQSPLAFYT
jgi:hypothetical protein